MTDNEALLCRMFEFDEGDAKRIQHLIKVYEFAHLIGVSEGIAAETQRILDAAAILHDIGIVPCERKYGRCNGKMQEKEGPAYAEAMLKDYGRYTDAEIERICYLIAHHHTYSNVDGIDYRILLEADFIVNAFEDGLSAEAVLNGRREIFETASGKHMLDCNFKLN